VKTYRISEKWGMSLHRTTKYGGPLLIQERYFVSEASRLAWQRHERQTRVPLVITDRDHNKTKTIGCGNKPLFENM